jgi:hypothetical protein
MKQLLTTAVFAAVACLSMACSSFERDWRGAVPESTSRPTVATRGGAKPSPEGAWGGTWRSDKNRHSGALRCLVRRPSETDSKQKLWEFRYHARFFGVMSSEFTTAQPVREVAPGRLVSKGDWTLPKWAGGAYHYEIEITATDFKGTYKGGGDHGTFSMKRP